jgi:hydrogenase maturation protease
VTGVLRLRVIGFGSFDAGDDAVGPLAVRAAKEQAETTGGLPGVEFVEAGPGIDVVDLLEGVDAVILVDAVRVPEGEGRPGRLVRLEVGPEGLPSELRTSMSSHGIGLAEGLAIARAMGRSPRVVFLGLQAWHERAGEPLSIPVAAALATLAGEIRLEARHLMDELASDRSADQGGDPDPSDPPVREPEEACPASGPPPHPPNLIVGAAAGHLVRGG